jgi:hypothetical protein
MRILWTLWLQYGESDNNWIDSDMRWPDYIRSASVNNVLGRLPVEAWIYRAFMENPGFRNSYIEKALKPFVRAMERAGGETLGYEIMNEPDIVWGGCHHSWTNNIKGPTNLQTHWKLSKETIRTFVSECSVGIRAVLSELHKDKLIFCGIQTSSDDSIGNYREFVSHEMDLLRPPDNNISPQPPPLYLSGSAITLYAAKQDWERDSITGRRSGDTRDHINKPRPFKVQDNEFLKWHNGKCMMSEAGGRTDNYDCLVHAQTISTILLESMKRGYAGVFIWHYNNPERRQNLAIGNKEANALTEGGVYSGSGISNFIAHNSNHRTHRRVFSEGRPATVNFRNFSEQYNRYIIPFLPINRG